MPFDFPDAPVSGDEIIGPGGQKYVWDSIKWAPAGSGGTGAPPVGDEPPDAQAYARRGPDGAAAWDLISDNPIDGGVI